jgi:hypothetical protein
MRPGIKSKETSMFSKPQKQHDWLQKLVGDWTLEADAGADGKTTGTEHVRSLGGLWVVCEGEGKCRAEALPPL